MRERHSAIWAEQVARAALAEAWSFPRSATAGTTGWMLIHTPSEDARRQCGETAQGPLTRTTGVARPGESMEKTDSGSCCCRRASRRAHHARSWSGDAARALRSSLQPPGLERRRPEAAGSWAAAAEEEEAAGAAETWKR